jgi:cellular nucleic acid-binding protein
LKGWHSDQTHAYAILTLTSANYANILIRDRLTIFQTKVRPKKQKQEPIQCLKCCGWGHFATECKASGDTCGNCRGSHHTNACKNKEKVYCITCSEYLHASWSRNCPEFNCRCMILDKKNPENAMPYFPTEHGWSLTVRPERIPLEVRFPVKYAVNSLASTGGKHPGLAPQPPCRKRKQGPTEAESGNPNLIPISQGRERDMPPAEEEPWCSSFNRANYGAENTEEDFTHRDSSWD